MSAEALADRVDAPHVGLFNEWIDAFHEANFRAAITRRRYRISFEPNNQWWQIRETTIPLVSHGEAAYRLDRR